MKKIIKIGISLLTVAVTLTACSMGNTNTGDNVLRLAQTASATSLNVLQTSSSVDYNVIANISEGLLQYDSAGVLVGALAENWERSEDGTKITFQLRDATWENGAPITAADFVYSFHARLTGKENVYGQYVAHLKNGAKIMQEELPVTELGAKAISDKVLELELEKPENYFLDMLVFPAFYPLNQKFVEEVGLDNFGTSTETFLANGPYTLSEFKQDFGWTYVKNATYWDVANVAIDEISVRVVEEAQTQKALWDQGEIDILTLGGDDIATYANNPQFHQTTTSRINYMYLSSTIPGANDLLENKNFRAAVAHSIDKDLIADAILKDGAIGVDGYVPSGVIAAEGKDFRELSGNFTTKMFNPKKAQEFYAKAKDELQFGDTPTFSLFISDAGMTPRIFENIEAQIEENLPGLDVTLSSYPSSGYFPKLYEHTTQAAVSQFEPAYKDIEAYMFIFQTGLSQNFSEWSNTMYDALYQEAESVVYANDPVGRLGIYAEMERILIEDYTIIPIYQTGTSYLVAEGIAGYQLDATVPHVAYKNMQIVK